MIDVKNISFAYKTGKLDKSVLKNISFSIDCAQVFCIIGPNGCGKTTLIDCILGLNKIGKGDIEFEGVKLGDLTPKEFAKHISYIPQLHNSSFSYTVLDIVSMGRTYATKMFAPPNKKQIQIAQNALKLVGLSDFEKRDYTKLSGGELQLVMIARAIAQKSKLMIMDEPTAHLDFKNEMEILDLIARLVKNEGLSVLMATHFLNQAYFLENHGVYTRVALMEAGGFDCVGKPSEVLTEDRLKSTFNIVTEIVKDSTQSRSYILPIRKEAYES